MMPVFVNPKNITETFIYCHSGKINFVTRSILLLIKLTINKYNHVFCFETIYKYNHVFYLAWATYTTVTLYTRQLGAQFLSVLGREIWIEIVFLTGVGREPKLGLQTPTCFSSWSQFKVKPKQDQLKPVLNCVFIFLVVIWILLN